MEGQAIYQLEDFSLAKTDHLLLLALAYATDTSNRTCTLPTILLVNRFPLGPRGTAIHEPSTRHISRAGVLMPLSRILASRLSLALSLVPPVVLSSSCHLGPAAQAMAGKQTRNYVQTVSHSHHLICTSTGLLHVYVEH